MNTVQKYGQDVIDLLSDPTMRLLWEEEGILGTFTLGIEKALKNHGMSQADLARKLGKKPQAISRAMRGGQNLSVHTMLEMALAVGQTVKLHIEPCEDIVRATIPIKTSSLFTSIKLDYKINFNKINPPKLDGVPSEQPVLCSGAFYGR